MNVQDQEKAWVEYQRKIVRAFLHHYCEELPLCVIDLETRLAAWKGVDSSDH